MDRSQVSHFTFGIQITFISPCTLASAFLNAAFPVRTHQ